MSAPPHAASPSWTGKRLSRKRWVQLLVGIAVSAGCLWLAARGLLADPQLKSSVWNALAGADYRTLPAMALGTLLYYWLKAWRWRLLLRPVGDFRTNRDLFPLVMIGFGFNNILPAQLGVVVRVLLFVRQNGVRTTSVIATVVLERIFDAVSVLVVLAFGLALLPELDPTIRRNALVFSAVIALLAIAILLYVFCTRAVVSVVERVLVPIAPPRFVSRFTRWLETGAEGLSAIRQPRLLAGVLALSLGSWFVNAAVIYLALWSFGVPASPLMACVVSSLTALGVAVPAAPGYFGVIQLCFMAVLGLFAADEASVFAASVYYNLTEYVLVTVIGLCFFSTTGLSFANVAATETNDDGEARFAPGEGNTDPH